MIELKLGGCLCGAVRYAVEGPAVFAGHCHCRTCQRVAGGPMKTVVAFSIDALKITQGQPKSYIYTADSGNLVESYFCPECGSQLFGKPAAMAGMVFLSAASFDDAEWIRPALHIYMSAAQPWDPTHDALPQFAKMPPPNTATNSRRG